MTDRPTRVVDAHVHIWDPARTDWYPYLSQPPGTADGDASRMYRAFAVDTYRAESAGWNVEKFVNVAAATGRLLDRRDPRARPRGGGPGRPRRHRRWHPPDGQVAEAVELLDRQMAAPRFRGVRPMGRYEGPLPDAGGAPRPGGARPGVRPDDPSRPAAGGGGRARPPTTGLAVVVEHTGWPRSDSDEERRPLAGRHRRAGRPRRPRLVQALGPGHAAWRPSSVDAFAPWIEYAIEAFGADRCMFASNFPVDSMYGTFDDLYTVFDRDHRRPRRRGPGPALRRQRRARLPLLTRRHPGPDGATRSRRTGQATGWPVPSPRSEAPDAVGCLSMPSRPGATVRADPVAGSGRPASR